MKLNMKKIAIAAGVVAVITTGCVFIDEPTPRELRQEVASLKSVKDNLVANKQIYELSEEQEMYYAKCGMHDIGITFTHYFFNNDVIMRDRDSSEPEIERKVNALGITNLEKDCTRVDDAELREKIMKEKKKLQNQINDVEDDIEEIEIKLFRMRFGK